MQVVPEHGQHGHDNRQRERPPESPLKVLQFRVVLVFELRQQRFQCHTALGTVTGVVLSDLRVHRAGVNRAAGCLSRGRHACRRHYRRVMVPRRVSLSARTGSTWRGIRRCVLRGIADERLQAMSAAEIVGTCLVQIPMFRVLANGHATHGIL
ncbi:hypothetical protein D9M68_809470 [compost metagenome]